MFLKEIIKMTIFSYNRRALFFSTVALIICIIMLLGATYAWFTDSATSPDNIITTGNLDVEMYWAKGTEDPTNANWIDASTGAIFKYDKWEPGYAEVRHIKIANEGTLSLKCTVNIIANGEVSDLADVIDVYYVDPAVQVADRAALTADNYLGTLTEVLANLDETGNGELEAETADTITIALVMQETAGNEYKNLSIGSTFSIQLLATQLSDEEDSFGKEFDKDATYPNVSAPVTLPAEDVTAPVALNANGMKVEVPAEVINALPDDVTHMSITLSDPVAEEDAISFKFVEFVDQNGEKIDLANNTTPIAVTFYVGNYFNAGDRVKVYHDGEAVAAVIVDEENYITYEALHFCEVVIAPNTDPISVVVSDASEFLAALENAQPGIVIDATGVSIDVNSVGTDIPGGKRALSIPGDITIKGLAVVGSYRGGNYLKFDGAFDQEVVLEDCSFEPSGRAMGVGFGSYADGVGSIVYNNCTFKGPVILEFANNPEGVATYNNCTFTKAASGNNYVMVYGGTHIFNGCTFDYTGVTQSSMGTINTGCVNSTSESDGSNYTVVILDGCTRINCGTRKYGANSTLTIK